MRTAEKLRHNGGFRRFLPELSGVGVPGRDDEAWRYVDLNPLLDAPFVPAPPPSGAGGLFGHEAPGAGRHLCFVNGFSAACPLSAAELPDGVVLEALSSAQEKHRELIRTHLGKTAPDGDYFCALNFAEAREGAFLHVPPGISAGAPAHFWFFGPEGAQPVFFHPRSLVIAAAGSRCTVVIHTRRGAGSAPYFMNAALEIHVSDNARVDVVVDQLPARDCYEFLAIRAALGRDARFHLTSAGLGEGVMRNDVRVGLEGPGASLHLRGLAVLGGDAGAHHHTVVHHKAPATTSRQVFKDILLDRARSEYSGLVHVHKEGRKSDSNQLNRNLLLSDEARAHSRPQLRIDADDVKCTHGSTTGQLPPEEIFYLRTRGLEEKAARSLLVCGFAEEIIGEVGESGLREELAARVRAKLDAAAGHD